MFNVNCVDHGRYYWLVVNYAGHGGVMADSIGELYSM